MVLLALSAAMPRAPEDGGANADAGVALEVSAVEAANPAPPQSPVLASKLSAIQSEIPAELNAQLTAQATREDPAAILTTDSPVLNAAKDEALSVLARDLLTAKAWRRTRPDPATTSRGSGTASRGA